MIQINSKIYLDEFKLSDKDQLVLLMNDKAIFENTLTIPFPYLAADAEQWLNVVFDKKQKEPIQTEWVIRNEDHKLIGGIGLVQTMRGGPHRNEIGYWLGKPYWGQGIMTKVVIKYVDYLLDLTDLVRIEARVFKHNPASARVLEKAGFNREGLHEKYCKKGDQYIDAYMFAKLRQV